MSQLSRRCGSYHFNFFWYFKGNAVFNYGLNLKMWAFWLWFIITLQFPTPLDSESVLADWFIGASSTSLLKLQSFTIYSDLPYIKTIMGAASLFFVLFCYSVSCGSLENVLFLTQEQWAVKIWVFFYLMVFSMFIVTYTNTRRHHITWLEKNRR